MMPLLLHDTRHADVFDNQKPDELFIDRKLSRPNPNPGCYIYLAF